MNQRYGKVNVDAKKDVIIIFSFVEFIYLNIYFINKNTIGISIIFVKHNAIRNLYS